MKTSEAIVALAGLCFDDLEDYEIAAINHAIEHMKKYQWRDIEDAPRDGTRVIVWAQHPNTGKETEMISSYSGDYPGDQRPYWRFSSPGYIAQIFPTRFMPIPDAQEGE